MTSLTAKKAEEILNDVPDHHHFRLHMGTDIKNLKELAEALEIMADRTFFHHIGPGKNDFSNWIKEVVDDKELAGKLRNTDTRLAMVSEIRKRVDFLERKPSEHKICTELCKKDFMKCGVNDFAVGTLVGFVIGVILAVVL